jgi:hypothetical protein
MTLNSSYEVITTTLNRIRTHKPCADGWRKLLAGLGKTEADDEPLPFATILRINGLADALWATRCEPQYDREWRLYAVWCARQCLTADSDPRSLKAIDVAERFARGEATADELAAAREGALAARAASDAWDAWAAWAASDASGASGASGAAWAAAWAARAAAWAASDASGAAWATRAPQTAEFLRVVGGEP